MHVGRHLKSDFVAGTDICVRLLFPYMDIAGHGDIALQMVYEMRSNINEETEVFHIEVRFPFLLLAA